VRSVLLAASLTLLLAASARASEKHPTLSELESQVMCLVCNTTLDQSHSPFADRERAFIRRRIAAGDTASEIKRALVAEYGEEILAAPPKKGFNLLVWLLPIVGVVTGAAVLGVLAWRWSRKRASGSEGEAPDPAVDGRVQVSPELEQRLDEELARFDV
jgi:cytochrome c-type biogenesis protein CcmH